MRPFVYSFVVMMEYFLSLHGFWGPLLEITGINIILSGDNAVVVVMAGRSLPQSRQRKAIVWGSFLVIFMGIILSIFAIRLLTPDWMKVVGSVLLLWIGIRLLQTDDRERGITAGTHLLDAVRIILLADAVMSLDKVIAVAAAAKGSMPLLIISQPIIITAGAGFLGWVAGGMAVSDLVLGKYSEVHHQLSETLSSLAGTIIVIGVGTFLEWRKSSRHFPTSCQLGMNFVERIFTWTPHSAR